MKKFCISLITIINCMFPAISPSIIVAVEHDRTNSIGFFTIEPISELRCLAQTAIWLDEEKIAVGKWDGSITVFNYGTNLSIDQALVPPHKAPVTALVKIDDHSFISSDGSTSIAAWTIGDGQVYQLSQSYQFDERYGAVDCALLTHDVNGTKLLTGHSNGYLLSWNIREGLLNLVASINLRSENPVDSPYPMWNIRKIVLWKNGFVVTASEDGDLCIVDYFKNQVKYRQRYSQAAKRGINDIAILENYLLLSNCSVGSKDKNLWLYQVDSENFAYLDSLNLISDQSNEQIFSFQVGLLSGQENAFYLCTTREGLLWYGTIKNNSFEEINFIENSLSGGAALAIHPTRKLCASANYNVKILELEIRG